MRIQDWSDDISTADIEAILPQFQEGVQSIDLNPVTTKFLVANCDIQEFAVTNTAEHLEARAIVAVRYPANGLSVCDVFILGIEGVLVSSIAVTDTDAEYSLTNTYHTVTRIHRKTEDPVNTQDVAYLAGVAVGAHFYELDQN